MYLLWILCSVWLASPQNTLKIINFDFNILFKIFKIITLSLKILFYAILKLWVNNISLKLCLSWMAMAINCVQFQHWDASLHSKVRPLSGATLLPCTIHAVLHIIALVESCILFLHCGAHISNYALVFLACVLVAFLSGGGFHIPASRATKIHTPEHTCTCTPASKSFSWEIYTIQHSSWSMLGRKEDNIRINRSLWSIKRVTQSWVYC